MDNISLRDYFAATALQGIMVNHQVEYGMEEFGKIISTTIQESIDADANTAYQYADAMVKESEKHKNEFPGLECCECGKRYDTYIRKANGRMVCKDCSGKAELFEELEI